MPTGNLERIFEPYYRDPHAQKVSAGWGLGLAFVHRIAEKHGGSVTIARGPGDVTFEIHLPANMAAVYATKVTA